MNCLNFKYALVWILLIFICKFNAEIFPVNKNTKYYFLSTVGEDGQIKIWSKTGMLRSTLAQQGMYCKKLKCLNIFL